jgi:pimeloyl-ACP methyl ester carboxylesterase
VTPDNPAAIQIDTPGGVIHGLHIGAGQPLKLLCLHGWLDNANSFVPLLPHLPNAEIVAIDLPGHGLSDHHSPGFAYTIASYAHTVLQVAEALDWSHFTLIGHSLGGSITPLCAVAAAEQIDKLVMIDALGPLSEAPSKLPERIRRFHEDFNNPNKHSGRAYASIEQAVETRLMANKMDRASAQLIVERQLMQTDEGYRWRFDRQLRLASPSYFTEEQVQEILKAIQCPVLCILAEDGYIVARDEMMPRLNSLANKTVLKIPGFHHLHMDTPEPIAAAINEFSGD